MLLNVFFVEIERKGNSSIIVGCIYRPPNTDVSLFNAEMSSILYKIRDSKLIFIAGDFNLDLIKVGSHEPTDEFLNTVATHSFSPIIRDPTRITETTATLIDNIYIF